MNLAYSLMALTNLLIILNLSEVVEGTCGIESFSLKIRPTPIDQSDYTLRSCLLSN